jgi:galactose mutarotase-like enzyme
MPFEALTVEHAGVRAELVPARGGIVTALSVGGKAVLYLDRATLDDPTRNVRGGIPILFPFAGKLADGRFVDAGTTMKQHGFGRDRAWQVLEQRAGLARLGLAADAETRAVYPYEFVAEQTVRALPAGLEVELLIHNRGDRPLPVSPGWHPYFCCPAGRKAEVSSRDLSGLTADRLGDDREFDFGLPAPATGRAAFSVPGLGRLVLEASPEMRHLQFWSQPGKDFICLEPFHGPANTVNTPARAEIPAGQARAWWMRIELA